MNKVDFILNAINPSHEKKDHFLFHIDVGVDGKETVIKKEPISWLNEDIEIGFLDSPNDGSEPQGVYTSLEDMEKDINKFDRNLGILYVETGHQPASSEEEIT